MPQFSPPSTHFSFAFRAFGAELRIESNSEPLLELARLETAAALIDRLEFIEPTLVTPDRVYGLYIDGDIYRLYENGTESTFGESKDNFINFYNAIVRVAVGELSESFVFLHAGVVGWNGKTIVLPANSFSGKTSLVVELVKLGAEYYSDEYAIIDANGLVHPFERDLSVRTDEGRTSDIRVAVESIGGRTGSLPLPVGTLLITKYEPDASFEPEELTLGNAIVETIPFAIPVLKQPDRTLKRLQVALQKAVRITSPRGEAAETARKLLAYIDSHG